MIQVTKRQKYVQTNCLYNPSYIKNEIYNVFLYPPSVSHLYNIGTICNMIAYLTIFSVLRLKPWINNITLPYTTYTVNIIIAYHKLFVKNDDFIRAHLHMNSNALPLVRLALYVSGLVTDRYLSKLISSRLSTEALLAR